MQFVKIDRMSREYVRVLTTLNKTFSALLHKYKFQARATF